MVWCPLNNRAFYIIGSSKEADCWEIYIEDNGVGMPETKCKEVMESMEGEQREDKHPLSGIGLRNVHQRLQLMFGENYRMNLNSIENQGTRIVIQLPLPSSVV